jgi:hypothetical protein
MNDFILLFSRMSYHLKCFEIANETIHKLHDFILEFYNNKFYFISLIASCIFIF